MFTGIYIDFLLILVVITNGAMGLMNLLHGTQVETNIIDKNHVAVFPKYYALLSDCVNPVHHS